MDIATLVTTAFAKPLAEKFVSYFSGVLKDHLAPDEQVIVNRITESLLNSRNARNKALSLYDPKRIHRLTEIFVPPIFSIPALNKSNKETTAYVSAEAIEFLKFDRRLILKGTAGMGKSTVMAKVFLDLLAGGEHLPILIELRNLNDYSLSIFHFILNEFNLSTEPEWIDALKAVLSNSSVVIILDAFDELAESKHAQFFTSLRQLDNLGASSRIMITTRPDDSLASLMNFTRAELQGLKVPQMQLIIDKLAEGDPAHSRLTAKLKEKKFVARFDSFLQVPLLLTLVLMMLEEDIDIPAREDELYASAYYTLFRNHDKLNKGFVKQPKSGLSFERILIVLAAYSIGCHLNSQFDGVAEANFRTRLEYVLKILGHESASVEHLITDLTTGSSIFIRDGLNFRLIHRTFLDYFSAVFLTRAEFENQREQALIHILPGGKDNKVLHLMTLISKDVFLHDWLRGHLSYSLRRDGWAHQVAEIEEHYAEWSNTDEWLPEISDDVLISHLVEQNFHIEFVGRKPLFMIAQPSFGVWIDFVSQLPYSVLQVGRREVLPPEMRNKLFAIVSADRESKDHHSRKNIYSYSDLTKILGAKKILDSTQFNARYAIDQGLTLFARLTRSKVQQERLKMNFLGPA